MSTHEESFYEILGVPDAADTKEIRDKYRTIARQTHPDTGADAAAVARYHRATEAYRVLSNSQLRREYDRIRRPPLTLHELFAQRVTGQCALQSVMHAPSKAMRHGRHACMKLTVPKKTVADGDIITLNVPQGLANAGKQVVLGMLSPTEPRTWFCVHGCGFPGNSDGIDGDLFVRVIVE